MQIQAINSTIQNDTKELKQIILDLLEHINTLQHIKTQHNSKYIYLKTSLFKATIQDVALQNTVGLMGLVPIILQIEGIKRRDTKIQLHFQTK